MATPKEDLNAKYHWRLDDAYNNWLGNKVIPYSRCYADAFKAYEKTRGDAVKAAEARADLYIAVGMIAGTALCGLGPVAGVISSGQRAVRIGNIAVANAANRMGIMSRGNAWGLMKKFTFGGVPTFTSTVWGSHGKGLVKSKIASFTTGGVAQVTSPAAGATDSIRSSGTQLPIEYYLMLDGLMLKTRNSIANTAKAMVDDGGVTLGELEEYWEQVKKGNFIKKAPEHAPDQKQMVRLANEMEMAIWTTSALAWRWESQHTYKVNRGPRKGETLHYSIPHYSGYLDSDPFGNDPVLERIDAVAKALEIDKYTIMNYEESRNAAGQKVLRSNSVKSQKQSWDDYFGFDHTMSEKDTFVKWANTYVVERARHVMMPGEFR